MQLSPTPVRQLADAVTRSASDLLRVREQPLHVYVVGGELQLQANLAWLSHAIDVLLRNTSDHTGDGVPITVIFERIIDQFQVRIRNASAEFEGLGLVDQFDRCSCDELEARELTLARKVIETHGGSVSAERLVEGLITIFTISLPLSKQESDRLDLLPLSSSTSTSNHAS